MMVEFAVELAAHGATAALAAGAAPTMFNLFATMHVAGWATLGAGFIVLILGVPHAAPLPIRIIGIIGALAMGLAGVLVAGFFLTQFGWLFIGGDLLATLDRVGRSSNRAHANASSHGAARGNGNAPCFRTLKTGCRFPGLHLFHSPRSLIVRTIQRAQ